MRHGLLATPRVEIHGHRGARWLYPEHSIAGFEHAIAAGADFVELDVVFTAGDVPVVWHDPILTRRKCQGPERRAVVRELELFELAEYSYGGRLNLRFPEQSRTPGLRIATLDQVLGLATRGTFQFNIEIKSHPGRLTPPPRVQAERVLEAVRAHRLEQRVRLQSFDREVLEAVREVAPEASLAILYTGIPRRFSTIARRAGTEIIGPYFRLVTRRRVEEAHEHGLRVIPWTVNHPRQWRRLLSDGVDGLITDNPSGLIAWMRGMGLRE